MVLLPLAHNTYSGRDAGRCVGRWPPRASTNYGSVVVAVHRGTLFLLRTTFGDLSALLCSYGPCGRRARARAQILVSLLGRLSSAAWATFYSFVGERGRATGTGTFRTSRRASNKYSLPATICGQRYTAINDLSRSAPLWFTENFQLREKKRSTDGSWPAQRFSTLVSPPQIFGVLDIFIYFLLYIFFILYIYIFIIFCVFWLINSLIYLFIKTAQIFSTLVSPPPIFCVLDILFFFFVIYIFCFIYLYIYVFIIFILFCVLLN